MVSVFRPSRALLLVFLALLAFVIASTAAQTINVPADVSVECDESTDPDELGVATATGCDSTTVSYKDLITPGPCAHTEDLVRTWTISCVVAGTPSTLTGSQTIHIADTTPPVLTIPADVTIECTRAGDYSVAALGGATVDDNCSCGEDLLIHTSDHIIPGDCPAAFTIERTFTSTDMCGNVGSATQTIVIQDTTAPVLTLPADVTLECQPVNQLGPLVTGKATGLDECKPAAITVTHSDETALGSPCGNAFVVSRTWTVTDPCGNAASGVQLIHVVDTTAPSFDNLPLGSSTLECSDDLSPSSVPATSDSCLGDAGLTVTHADERTDGSCADQYTIERTWTVTDGCGNAASATETINVVDTTAPVLTAPASATVECDADHSIAAFAAATATDNCDDSVSITHSDVSAPGACINEQTITRTFTASDNCGNSVSAVQVISVVDTTAPTFTNTPADTTVECVSGFDLSPVALGSATGTDNCDNSVSVAHADQLNADCNSGVVISRTWTLSDNCGNDATAVQVITIQDTQDPILDSVPADITLECTPALLGAATLDTGLTGEATGHDACDTQATVVFSDTENGALNGCPDSRSVTRTWSITDRCGHSTSADQQIVVVDSVAPTFTNQPADATVGCDSDFSVAGLGSATAEDVCDASPDVTHSDVSTASACLDVASIARTWTACDNCGNCNSYVQQITVQDVTAPVLSVPADAVLPCNEDTSPAAAGSATATDNCDPNPTVTFTDSDETSADCPFYLLIHRTWTAVDRCGNENSAVQEISVNDETAPTLSLPADVTVECSDMPPPECPTLVLDFEHDCANPHNMLNAGDFLSLPATPFADCGITISVTGEDTTSCSRTRSGRHVHSNSHTHRPTPFNAMVFDSDCHGAGCSGGDWDLQTPGYGAGNTVGEGNILIISEDNDQSDPDDSRWGGEVSFHFSPSRTVFSVDLLDIETRVGFVSAYDCSGTLLSRKVQQKGGSNNRQTVDMANNGVYPDGVCLLTVQLREAGAIINMVSRPDVCDLTDPTTVEEAGAATATDNCDEEEDVTVTHSDVTVPVGDAACGNYNIERSWTAVDRCGNSASGVQTISVVDSTAPQMKIPEDKTVDCDGPTTDCPARSVDFNTFPDGSAVPAGTIFSDQYSAYEGMHIATRQCSRNRDCHPPTAYNSKCPCQNGGNSKYCCTGRDRHLFSVAEGITMVIQDDDSNEPDDYESPWYFLITFDYPVTVYDIGFLGTQFHDDMYFYDNLNWNGERARIRFDELHDGESRSYECRDSDDEYVSGVRGIKIGLSKGGAITHINFRGEMCRADGAPIQPVDTGRAHAWDNCHDATVSYADVTVPGATPCDDSVVERTWTAVDTCGNEQSQVQSITIHNANCCA